MTMVLPIEIVGSVPSNNCYWNIEDIVVGQLEINRKK